MTPDKDPKILEKKLELELRKAKLDIAYTLAENMVQLNHDEWKDFKIADDKSRPYIEATIDLLKKQVKLAKKSTAKSMRFDKILEDRKDLSEDELKEWKKQQAATSRKADSILATLEPRASLKGRKHSINTIVLRYRGDGIDEEFSKKYPQGVLL